MATVHDSQRQKYVFFPRTKRPHTVVGSSALRSRWDDIPFQLLGIALMHAADILIDQPVAWCISWLIGRLIGWLIGCLGKHIVISIGRTLPRSMKALLRATGIRISSGMAKVGDACALKPALDPKVSIIQE